MKAVLGRDEERPCLRIGTIQSTRKNSILLVSFLRAIPGICCTLEWNAADD